MVRVPGSWKSLDELEDNVTLPELERMLAAARDIESSTRKFLAAVQGINLDDNSEKARSFEEIENRAKARLAGVSEEELTLTELGFQVVSEDDNE